MAKSLSIGETILIIFVRKRKRENQVAEWSNLLPNVPDWKGLRRKSENHHKIEQKAKESQKEKKYGTWRAFG